MTQILLKELLMKTNTMKTINKKNFISLILCFVFTIAFCTFKLIFDSKYLNTETMQYSQNISFVLLYYIIALVIITATIFVVSILLNKNVEYSSCINKISNKVASCIIIVICLTVFICLLSISSFKLSYNNEVIISKIFSIVYIVSSLFSAVIVFNGIKNSKTNFLYYLLILSPIFYFISSYFSQIYTINDKNRFVCNFMMIITSLFLFYLCNELIYGKKSKFTYPLAIVVVFVGTVCIISELYNLLVLKTQFNHLSLSIFISSSYLIYAYNYIFSTKKLG